MAWIAEGKRDGQTVRLVDPGTSDGRFDRVAVNDASRHKSKEHAIQAAMQAIRDGVSDIKAVEVPIFRKD